MAHTVVGAFQNTARAREAVRQLEAQGFTDREVSLVGPDDKGRNAHDGRDGHDGHDGHMRQDPVSDGATWGAGIGGAAGLLAAAGVVAIPGIGPILAAGPLATALTGAAAGGIGGAFMDAGIPAASSKRYEDEIKRGHAVVTVKAEDNKAQTAKNVLAAQGAHDIEVD